MAHDNPHFLVTGASGPTGSWVVGALIDAGARVTAFDGEDDDRRLRLIRPWAPHDAVRRVVGDVAEVGAVAEAMEGTTHVIHTTRVAVAGEPPTTEIRRTLAGGLAVFEAAGRCGVEAVAYDLPAGVPDPGGPPAPAEGEGRGVLEDTLAAAGRRLWSSASIPTQGLRVGAVYGAGHDEGWAAGLTGAIAAAVRNVPLVVPPTSPVPICYVADVARALVEGVRRAPDGASVVDLPGHEVPVADFVSVVRELTGNDTVRVGGPRPTPDGHDRGAATPPVADLRPTPLRAGIRDTLELFRWAPEALYPDLTPHP